MAIRIRFVQTLVIFNVQLGERLLQLGALQGFVRAVTVLQHAADVVRHAL